MTKYKSRLGYNNPSLPNSRYNNSGRSQKISVSSEFLRKFYNKKNAVIAIELSKLKANNIHLAPFRFPIIITNIDTKQIRKFFFTHTDNDNENIFGWNYKSTDGIKLLLIND